MVAVACIGVASCEAPPGPTTDAGQGPISSTNHPAFPIGLGTSHAFNTATSQDGLIGCPSCHTDPTTFRSYSCVSCHEHRQTGYDADAGRQGMDEAHAGTTGYQYDSRLCLDCHPTGIAGEVGRGDHAFFPITQGTAHELIGCNECHASESRATVTCTGCHRDTNQDSQSDHDVAPMLAVHGSDMVKLGYAWDTAACLGCHPSAQVPGLLNHGGAFPIDAGTVHASVACLDCHPSRQDHSQVRCVSCHQQVNDGAGPREVHGQTRMAEGHDDGGLPGYQWESGSCYLCHQRSQVPGEIQHDTMFPIGPTSSHALGSTTVDTPPVQIGCPTCHVAAFGSGTDGGQTPTGGSLLNIDCTQCHAHAQAVMQPTHGAFPDYQWQSAACIFCHLGGAKKLEHTAFPLDAGTTHELGKAIGDPPVTVTCSSCHASKVQLKLLSCTGCHRHDAAQSTSDHGTQMTSFGYQYDPGACFGCHPTSQVPGIFDHEPIWKLQPPSGNGQHALLTCGDCHASKSDRRGSLSCTNCHQPANLKDSREAHARDRMAEVHLGIADYQWSPTICIGCHLDGTRGAGRLHLNHSWFPIAPGAFHALSLDGGTAMTCAGCHPAQTTAGDRDFGAQAINCTTCHQPATLKDSREVHGQTLMAEKHSGVDSYAWRSAACLDCHPIGEKSGVFSHANFPISSGTKHAGISCSECHLGTGPKTDVTQLNCAGCHASKVNLAPKVGEIHTGVPGYAGDSAGCFNCHPHSERVGPMNHTSWFPVAVGAKHASSAYLASLRSGQTTCTACHASRVDRTNESCQSCHATLKSPKPPALAHWMMPAGFEDENDSPGCKKCHADPTPVYRLINHPDPGYNHRGATCQECHQGMRLDKPYAIDFSKSACSCASSSCHDVGDQRCR